jgi:hypothetical protein
MVLLVGLPDWFCVGQSLLVNSYRAPCGLRLRLDGRLVHLPVAYVRWTQHTAAEHDGGVGALRYTLFTQLDGLICTGACSLSSTL